MHFFVLAYIIFCMNTILIGKFFQYYRIFYFFFIPLIILSIFQLIFYNFNAIQNVDTKKNDFIIIFDLNKS